MSISTQVVDLNSRYVVNNGLVLPGGVQEDEQIGHGRDDVREVLGVAGRAGHVVQRLRCKIREHKQACYACGRENETDRWEGTQKLARILLNKLPPSGSNGYAK